MRHASVKVGLKWHPLPRLESIVVLQRPNKSVNTAHDWHCREVRMFEIVEELWCNQEWSAQHVWSVGQNKTKKQNLTTKGE